MSGRSFVNSLGETQLDLAGLVKSQLIEGFLKDFSFKLRSTYKNKKMELKLASFDDALKVNLSNEDLGKIEIENLSLGDLFKKEFVLSKINGEYSLPKLTDLTTTNYSSFLTKGSLSFLFNKQSYGLVNGSLKVDAEKSSLLNLEAKNSAQELILIKFGQDNISKEFVFSVEPKDMNSI